MRLRKVLAEYNMEQKRIFLIAGPKFLEKRIGYRVF